MSRRIIPLLIFALLCNLVESSYLVFEKDDEHKLDPARLKEIEEYVKSKRPTIVNADSPDANDSQVIGDMLVEEIDFKIFFSDEQARKGITTRENLWPRENNIPTVPYVNLISNETYPDFSRLLNESLRQFERHTCIKFRPRQRTDVSYIKIYYGEGCHSRLGRSFVNGNHLPQTLSLGEGCHLPGTIMHEVGHALGMLHEQMRADRDDYLQINLDNVDREMLNNFDKITTSNFSDFGIPYDYTSVMHYDPIAFTTYGGVTMRTVDPQYQGLIGVSEELSHRDKLLTNVMYDCLDDWLSKCGLEEDPCKGEGYTAADCKCVCPPGTRGDRCQIVDGTYYDHLLPKCNRIITENGTKFATPNYSHDRSLLPNGLWCVFQIQAPADHDISVIFHGFRLDQVKLSGPNHCVLSYLVFMVDNDQDIVVCGKDVVGGDTFNFTTNKLTMFLNHILGIYARGFEASVFFYPTNSSGLKTSPRPPASGQVTVPSASQQPPKRVYQGRKSQTPRTTSEVMSDDVKTSTTVTQLTNEFDSVTVKNETTSSLLESTNKTVTFVLNCFWVFAQHWETVTWPPKMMGESVLAAGAVKNLTLESGSNSSSNVPSLGFITWLFGIIIPILWTRLSKDLMFMAFL